MQRRDANPPRPTSREIANWQSRLEALRNNADRLSSEARQDALESLRSEIAFSHYEAAANYELLIQMMEECERLGNAED
ncbi:MAG: hypothetical protein ACTS27_13285 [Phycisphaerales bacterium]